MRSITSIMFSYTFLTESHNHRQETMTEADTCREPALTWIQGIVIIFIAVIIIAAVLATPPVVAFMSAKEASTAGEYGDMFGSVNALFSGFAFLGVVVAIFLQSQELRSQREVQTGQRKEMTVQNESLRKQQFESMFFQMISLHNQIVNDLDYTDRNVVRGSQISLQSMTGSTPKTKIKTEVFRGRDVFKVLYKQFRSFVEKKDQADCNAVTTAYNEFYQKNSADLGHYFRNLYTVIKYVDGYAGSTPQVYVNIVRAQLSAFELVLLFYNCTCGEGRGRFKAYVEKYALLEHLEKGLLLDSKHEAWMEPNAFEEA